MELGDCLLPMAGTHAASAARACAAFGWLRFWLGFGLNPLVLDGLQELRVVLIGIVGVAGFASLLGVVPLMAPCLDVSFSVMQSPCLHSST
jgi:hypothetical protein